MYYEEKIVDGVWCWRNDPKGEWVPCDNSKILNLLRERDELMAKLGRVRIMANTALFELHMPLSCKLHSTTVMLDKIIKECE